MIVYPINWNRNYEDLSTSEKYIDVDISEIIDIIYDILKDIEVFDLAYSGGIDSTLILSLLSEIGKPISTYTISTREDHPDIQFACIGSSSFKSKHKEFIVQETTKETDKFKGDNVVRQFFENVQIHTNSIINCDGIDEFMCGYYDHIPESQERYYYYLSRLLPDHLIPLDKNSGGVKVYLPYLDDRLINILRNITLREKIANNIRKRIMVDIASYRNIPEVIINRNKYGFCDAFIKENK